jgi:hypothetical protein
MWKMKFYKHFNGQNFPTEKAYFAEWMRIIDKLNGVLGPDARVTGFDPTVSIAHNTDYHTAQIPMWMVLKLIGETKGPKKNPPEYMKTWKMR